MPRGRNSLEDVKRGSERPECPTYTQRIDHKYTNFSPYTLNKVADTLIGGERKHRRELTRKEGKFVNQMSNNGIKPESLGINKTYTVYA